MQHCLRLLERVLKMWHLTTNAYCYDMGTESLISLKNGIGNEINGSIIFMMVSTIKLTMWLAHEVKSYVEALLCLIYLLIVVRTSIRAVCILPRSGGSLNISRPWKLSKPHYIPFWLRSEQLHLTLFFIPCNILVGARLVPSIVILKVLKNVAFYYTGYRILWLSQCVTRISSCDPILPIPSLAKNAVLLL